MPEDLLPSRELMPAEEARHAVHFPQSPGQADDARRRLAYEELFIIQVLLALRRRLFTQPVPGTKLPVPDSVRAELESALPFELTKAQQRVLTAVTKDLRSDQPALRLIHGDVGSGKTIIAAHALLAAVQGRRQAAFLAPTEILAEQHRRSLTEFLRPMGIKPVLLTGSLSQGDKDRIRKGLQSGDIPLVVGTHALLQQSTEFDDLAVVVVDEQHRFGVLQRASLAGKGKRPHLFVMTATPIPRTLALVAYGDCDVSVLDELPSGRKPPQTRLIASQDRDKAYAAVRETVEAGHQAFIVCPLIEESDSLQAEAAIARHEELKEGALK
ncbi:MAG TPA: DEAD/DEAH box helicase family protein, partial [Dehalococcoidia bacterium]|nr:DEAD/DEAH box helicase family protein [Dehalococcoidia bacterium]